MLRSFKRFVLFLTLSTQFVFASSAESKRQLEMYNNLVQIRNNLGLHIRSATKKSPEYRLEYQELVTKLKSDVCKVGIKKDLSFNYKCGEKSIKAQFLVGENYFLLEVEKIPFSLLKNKKAFLKRGQQILSKENTVTSFFNQIFEFVVPKAKADWVDLIVPGLLGIAVISEVYNYKKRRKLSKKAIKEREDTIKDSSEDSERDITPGAAPGGVCSTSRYFDIRPDVLKNVKAYYKKNNLIRSDKLDYERSLTHFVKHGRLEGMCQPQAPGFVDPEVEVTPPPTTEPDTSGLKAEDITVGFDINKVIWMDTNVKNWAQTSTITSLKPSQKQICITHSKGGKWKGGYPLGPSVVSEGNHWVFVKLNGKVYAGTYEWLRIGQTCKLGHGIYRGNAYGDLGDPNRLRGKLRDWTPRSGDVVGFMVSGLARSGTRNVEERSDIKFVTLP